MEQNKCGSWIVHYAVTLHTCDFRQWYKNEFIWSSVIYKNIYLFPKKSIYFSKDDCWYDTLQKEKREKKNQFSVIIDKEIFVKI